MKGTKERFIQIVKKLTETDDFIRIEDLAKELHVSSRTIRYDLDKIDDFLKSNNFHCLIRKPKKGIKFSDSTDKSRVLFLLKSKIDSYWIFTKEERKVIILFELFSAKGYVTIEYLRNLLKVSRGTVIRELKSVNKWLTSQGLKLKSLPHYGLKIEGEEVILRQAILVFVAKNVGREKLLSVLKSPAQIGEEIVERCMKQFLQEVDLSYIVKVVKSIEKHLSISNWAKIYEELILYLAISTKRIKLGHTVSIPKGIEEDLKTTAEYFQAVNIAKRLGKKFNVEFPIEEIVYITIYLLSGKLVTNKTLLGEDEVKIEIVTLQLIYNVGKSMGVNFIIDEELYKNLRSHLISAIWRLKYGLPIFNPMLKTIKNKYPNILRSVKNSIKIIEKIIGCKINEDEVGYITLHFAASLERNKLSTTTNVTYKALVVCATGYGTAQVLASRLEKEFPNIKIEGVVGNTEVNEFILTHSIDIVISTVPLNISKVLVVEVSPLLTIKDISKIKKYLEKQSMSNFVENQKNPYGLENLIEIIKRHCTIENQKELVKELMEFIDKSHFSKKENIYLPKLNELLTLQTIKVNVEGGC